MQAPVRANFWRDQAHEWQKKYERLRNVVREIILDQVVPEDVYADMAARSPGQPVPDEVTRVVAAQLGVLMLQEGIATIETSPILVPSPDGPMRRVQVRFHVVTDRESLRDLDVAMSESRDSEEESDDE